MAKIYGVVWTRSAKLDLELIVQYLKSDSARVAREVLSDIKKECESLCHFPLRKKVVPELQQVGILKYREIVYKRWRIMYKLESEMIFIVLVVDMRRNLEDVLLQRLLGLQ